jgi:hypothetical protein
MQTRRVIKWRARRRCSACAVSQPAREQVLPCPLPPSTLPDLVEHDECIPHTTLSSRIRTTCSRFLASRVQFHSPCAQALQCAHAVVPAPCRGGCAHYRTYARPPYTRRGPPVPPPRPNLADNHGCLYPASYDCDFFPGRLVVH